MPSTITHSYIAIDVLERLNKKELDNYIENYKTYSQGMDILYFYNILIPFIGKKVNNFGGYVHKNKIKQLLIELTKNVHKTKNKDEFIYLIGLLTHFVADLNMHTYVNYKSKKMARKYFSERDNHFMIETYLDNYLINKREKIAYYDFKCYEFSFNTRIPNNVVELINMTFKSVYGIANIGKYYSKGLKDMKFFFRIIRYDRRGIKRKIYNLLNVITRIIFRDVRYLSYNFKLDNDNLLNTDKEDWYIGNARHDESILELYDLVVEKATNLINDLYDYVYLDKKIDLNNLFNLYYLK